jgi:peptide/nickel transport system substrate-binding protein
MGRKSVVVLAAAAVSAAVLAGCSSSGGTSGSTSGGSGGSGGSSGSGGSAPAVLTIGTPAIPPSIDQITDGTTAYNTITNFSATLLQFKPLAANATVLDSPADVAGDLASSWQITPQGIDLTLRDAKAANGDVLTPQDVQWTFQRAVALKDGVAAFYMSLAGINPQDPVTILGPHEVRINGKITPLGLVPLTEYNFSIIDATLAKQHATSSDPWASKWLASNTANFAAYGVADFEPNSEVILTANPNYWAGKPAWSRVVLTATSSQSMAELVKSGSLGYAFQVPLAQFKQFEQDSSLKTLQSPSLDQDVLRLNPNSGPFANADVRRAISMAIDRQALVEGPYQTVGKPAVSPITTAIPLTSGTSQYYDYNLAAAKALLAQTPYKSGFSFTLYITQAEVSPVDVNSLALNLQSQLSKLGITVNVDTVANDSDFVAAEVAHKYSAWLEQEGAATADAGFVFSLNYVSTGVANFGQINVPQINSLVAAASALPIGSARTAKMDQAIAVFNQQMPEIPLVQTSVTYAFAKYVCGQGTSAYQLVLPQTLKPC